MVRRYPLKPKRPRLIRGRGVMAAYPPFKRQGVGSTPSGPTESLARSSTAEPAPYKGQKRFQLIPGPLIWDSGVSGSIPGS